MKVFKDQFKENGDYADETILEAIPKLITEEQNGRLEKSPTKEEVKQVVFDLIGDSASGSDSFLVCFFRIAGTL